MKYNSIPPESLARLPKKITKACRNARVRRYFGGKGDAYQRLSEVDVIE